MKKDTRPLPVKVLATRLAPGGRTQMVGLGAPEPGSKKTPVVNGQGSYDEAGYHAILSPETRARLLDFQDKATVGQTPDDKNKEKQHGNNC